MSSWSSSHAAPSSLSGSEGELVCLRIAVEPRALEEVLETLAGVSFPVNPQIYHPSENASQHHRTVVEFPAYSGQLKEVRTALSRAGFEPGVLEVRSMLERIGYRAAVA
jgi:hypothetical protein